MRILILSNVPPGSVGGAEVQALHLARCWSATGHKVTVAGYANQPFFSDNLTVVRLSTLQGSRALRAVSYITATLWLLWRRRSEYDLIYCRFLKEQTFVASLAKYVFRLRQPLIACPACASTGGEAEYISGSRLKKIWIKLLGLGVTVINAMSRQIEQEIQRLEIDNVRISRIPNGVVLPGLNPSRHSVNPGLQILFVGRLVEQKGLDILLRAASLLKEKRQDFEIRIIGSGPLRSRLENQVRELELDTRVNFVGAVKPDEVAAQLAGADLFVLPSRYEGFPGVLLEAIAYGLPAIATRVSGSEEIIDDSMGWLIPIDDAFALASAIEEALVLGHEKLGEMGDKARDKAVHNYDMNRVASDYLQLFEEVTEL